MSRSVSRQDKLAALARPLKPERAPYYLRAENRPVTLRRELPATGWYWRPAGHPVAVYLGRNYDEARDELVDHLRRQLTSEDAAA
jgi:hypothetical protein